MLENEKTIERYFAAWKNQSSSDLPQIFTIDARYVVHPFGLEEHVGIEAIQRYWEQNPIAKQVEPQPYVITKLVNDDAAFIEWQCDYTNKAQETKRMRGMMILEFRDGKIKELREHFEIQIL